MSDALTYVRHEKVYLKTHPNLNEAWLHERIIEDPAILGFGDLRVIEHERIQAGAGRLDLLLNDDESNRRYEVEIMLGATDPSHIIRTIEYWDIERRRYPGYEHIAVLVAEDITSRFLNVLSLLSGNIPFIAIQLSAFRIGSQICLNFVRVLDQTELRIDDSTGPGVGEPVDRKYWDAKVGAPLMQMCDEVLVLVNKHSKSPQELNFLDHYIGLRSNGVVNNFVSLHPRPQKRIVHVSLRTSLAQELYERFQEAAIPAKLNGGYVNASFNAETLETHRVLLDEAIAATVKDNDV